MTCGSRFCLKDKEIMPVVDVVNLDGKKVGQVELLVPRRLTDFALAKIV